MKGQWIGTFTGNNTGVIIINIDELEDHFEGKAILHFAQPGVPVDIAFLKTPDKQSTGNMEVSLLHIDPSTNATFSKQDLATKYPSLIFPDGAAVQYAWTDKTLQVSWTTSIGSSGKATLTATNAGAQSEYAGTTMSWLEFKKFIDALPYRKSIFRGQDSGYRLRTTYHRTGRSDLMRYLDIDIKALYGALAGRTRYPYDLNIPEQNGAFLHLAQHHGYPTPLLDWSYSPYVAAFCAFRNVSRTPRVGDKVRIFIFDHLEWQKDLQPILMVSSPRLHLSVLESIAFDNDRTGPQQALSLVTNLDDVESYISKVEKDKGKSYLSVIDIYSNERGVALRDLSRMGISAGSMFPGLDGACEELRERLFPS